MSRPLRIACVLGAALMLCGCSAGTTYSRVFTLRTDAHYCREVTTTDTAILSDLAAAGYEEGTCALAGYSGATCTFSGTGSDSAAYTITEYYRGDYYTDSAISSQCAAEGGAL